MNKTWRLGFGIMLALALLAASCGDDGDDAEPAAPEPTAAPEPAAPEPTAAPEPAAPEPVAPAEVVELTVVTGFSGPDRPAYEAIVESFNAAHPNIQVTMDIQPWDSIGQTLPTAWATGSGPDLATPNYLARIRTQKILTEAIEI